MHYVTGGKEYGITFLSSNTQDFIEVCLAERSCCPRICIPEL